MRISLIWGRKWGTKYRKDTEPRLDQKQSLPRHIMIKLSLSGKKGLKYANVKN